ncbi:hypothetical protein EV356DRAFT_101902 [Viridothelium virens]|uniref:Nephrocystin 3-like N-terminal domain-containing protein n=1 Tax=Viridothelium virens TaxID=1048519 RepID=A0A6A6HNY2_VIRVR|nr:hypothetical protein EV356DRAFT_101902 [Viridothelium virens]
MSRGRVYERQLRNSRPALDTENIKNFERFLVKMYEQTLLFYASAYRHYTGGAWYRTWSSVWEPDAITNFERDTIQIQKDMQDEAATMFQIGIQGDMVAIFQELGELKSLIENRPRRHLAVLKWLSNLPYIEYHLNARDGRTAKTGGWIFRRKEYETFLTSGNPCILWIHGIPGAGKTKLISTLVDRFKPQLVESASAVGQTGYGPDYETKGKDESGGSRHIVQFTCQVAFFYCRSDNDDRRSSVFILRSLIKQLASSCCVLTPEIMDTYRRKGPDSGIESLSIQDCKEMLESIIDVSGEVLLILDALDECSEESKKSLLDVIDFLIKSHLQVKIIISSREDPGLSRLEQSANVRISATDNEDDILKFVRQRICDFKAETQDDTRECPRVPPYLESKIIETFKGKSQGMFQWAAMMIVHLLSLSSADEIKNALPALPTNLTDIYSEVFQLIDRETDGWRNIATCAFVWLQAAGGSCEMSIVVAAASQHFKGHGDINRTMQEAADVLRVCRNLLVVERDTVRFSHLSIQEYFKDYRPEAQDCHTFAARICLRTLLYYNTEERSSSPKLNDLWDYACKSWSRHVAWAPKDPGLEDLLDKFLKPCPPSPGCARWLSRLATDMVRLTVTEHQSVLGTRAGLSSIVFRPDDWLSLPQPSHISHEKGHVVGAFSLLDALVAGYLFKLQSRSWMRLDGLQSIIIELRQYRLSEHWRFAVGFSERSRMLGSPALRHRYSTRLENRNITVGQCYDNPTHHSNGLRKAVSQIHKNITEAKSLYSLLVMFLTSLIWMVVRHLSSKNWHFMELGWAGVPNNDKMMEICEIEDLASFLDEVTRAICEYNVPGRWKVKWEMATLTTTDGPNGEHAEKWSFDGLLPVFQYYRTAAPQYLQELARATLLLLCMKSLRLTESERHLVDYLFSVFDLSRDLDYQYLRIQNFDRRPLLVTLDQLYELRLVEFLVGHGADVNFVAEDKAVGSFGTVLIAAIGKAEEQGASIVEVLLKSPELKDVNVLARVGDFGTALIAACKLGKEDIVELLLQHSDINVNVKASIGDCGTALIAACSINDIAIVKKLLGKHANIGLHTTQGKYATALTAAL